MKTLKKEFNPTLHFQKSMEESLAKYYSQTLSNNIKRGIIAKRKQKKLSPSSVKKSKV